MEVIVADPCGFCYGVKRAVQIAESAADSLPAATLGPLIHNPQFTEAERDPVQGIPGGICAGRNGHLPFPWRRPGSI